jgi:hypothetical protein
LVNFGKQPDENKFHDINLYNGADTKSCNVTHVENVVYYRIHFYKNNIRGAYIWFSTHDYENIIFADGSSTLVRIWITNDIFSIEGTVPNNAYVYFRYITATNFGPV